MNIGGPVLYKAFVNFVMNGLMIRMNEKV